MSNNQEARRVVPVTFLAIVAAILCFNVLASAEDDLTKRLMHAVQMPAFEDSTVDDYRALLTDLLAGSEYSARLNINQPLREGFVNFYLLDPAAAHRLDLPIDVASAGLFGSCGYLGVHNVIVCDSSFFDEFSSRHHLAAEIPDSIVASETGAYQAAIMSWVLGHELGHLAHHDGEGYLNEGASMDEKGSSRELDQAVEIQADLYGAELVCKRPKACAGLERMLIALINQDVQSLVGKSRVAGVGIIWDYTSKEMISYFSQTDHPSAIYRATRMLGQVAKLTNDVALESLLQSFSRHLKGTN